MGFIGRSERKLEMKRILGGRSSFSKVIEMEIFGRIYFDFILGNVVNILGNMVIKSFC